MENIGYVQQGFRILLPSLAGFIAQELNKKYKDAWWDEVLDCLTQQQKAGLPLYGAYATLVDSLDIANCIRIIKQKWNDIFYDYFESKDHFGARNYKNYVEELMGVRNAVAHNGQQDLDQPVAERALDTMLLLCKAIDADAADEIRELYNEIRFNSTTGQARPYEGPSQPSSDMFSGTSSSESLLGRAGAGGVEKTQLTRKITINGKTQVYPVYKINLNLLYYNDQNDRIATWISRYEAENGDDSLRLLDRDLYNRIIEGFIYESNPESIKKTQNNIAAVGQRLPGVILDDGRVIDGNRRFTCLRRIQRTSKEPVFFETAILQADMATDQKQIKLLELAIQHGEEEKVDYDQIDYAVGTYRDIVQTHLLSINEYATTTNESETEVQKRIKVAGYMNEFLDFIHLPGQYFAVREYQIYDLLVNLIDILKKMDKKQQKKVKNIVFANIMMRAVTDSRKYSRDIKKLLKSPEAAKYCTQQENLIHEIEDQYRKETIKTKTDVDKFADEHKDIADEMQISMQNALFAMRNELLRVKPEENVGKATDLLTDIDQRQFRRMTSVDRKQLIEEMEQLQAVTNMLLKKLKEYE